MTGDELRAWRKKWNLSRAELVRRLDVDYSTVWRWEAGRVTVPAWLPIVLQAIERDLRKEKRPHSEE